MTKSERHLQITCSYINDKALPELRLKGVWFSELGFNIGDKVNVITPLKPNHRDNK
jgi:hypothetical protein